MTGISALNDFNTFLRLRYITFVAFERAVNRAKRRPGVAHEIYLPHWISLCLIELKLMGLQNNIVLVISTMS